MKRILLHVPSSLRHSSIQKCLILELRKYFHVHLLEEFADLRFCNADLFLTTENPSSEDFMDLHLDAPVSFHVQLPDILVIHLFFLSKPIDLSTTETLLDCFDSAREVPYTGDSRFAS